MLFMRVKDIISNERGENRYSYFEKLIRVILFCGLGTNIFGILLWWKISFCVWSDLKKCWGFLCRIPRVKLYESGYYVLSHSPGIDFEVVCEYSSTKPTMWLRFTVGRKASKAEFCFCFMLFWALKLFSIKTNALNL